MSEQKLSNDALLRALNVNPNLFSDKNKSDIINLLSHEAIYLKNLIINEDFSVLPNYMKEELKISEEEALECTDSLRSKVVCS